MEAVFDYIGAMTGLNESIQIKLLISLSLLGVSFVTKKIVFYVLHKRLGDVKKRYVAQKTASYILAALVVIVLINVWFRGFTGFQTYLGLLSAGIAISLKDPLTNLAAWFFILARKPFKVGDRIEIGGNKGDVIDVRVFQFLMLEVGNRINAEQSTGRILYVPNSHIFTQVSANYTTGFPFIWNEIAVLITFESDWRQAKVLLMQAAQTYFAPIRAEAERTVNNASKLYLIAYRELNPAVYTSVKDSGVQLTLRFLCETRQKRKSEEILWEAILDAFDKEEHIDLAYPTLRYINDPLQV
ncbi:mechanosensitive ion channel [Treponema sp.]